jgi:2',3'-cyclic-nucleotide 2'-phosphodiesterase/3'-nucleotidase
LAKYVKAAYVKGVTQGRTGSVFGFGDDIRRDEAVVMLLRAYAVDFSSIDTTTGFTDTVELAEDFQKAISKAVSMEIVGGQNGKFRPGDSITRGEAAKIIWKMASR